MRRETPTSKAYSFQPGKMPVPVSTDLCRRSFFHSKYAIAMLKKSLRAYFASKSGFTFSAIPKMEF